VSAAGAGRYRERPLPDLWPVPGPMPRDDRLDGDKRTVVRLALRIPGSLASALHATPRTTFRLETQGKAADVPRIELDLREPFRSLLRVHPSRVGVSDRLARKPVVGVGELVGKGLIVPAHDGIAHQVPEDSSTPEGQQLAPVGSRGLLRFELAQHPRASQVVEFGECECHARTDCSNLRPGATHVIRHSSGIHPAFPLRRRPELTAHQPRPARSPPAIRSDLRVIASQAEKQALRLQLDSQMVGLRTGPRQRGRFETCGRMRGRAARACQP
jgi:hypothetical protein